MVHLNENLNLSDGRAGNKREILENVGAGKGNLSTVNLMRDSDIENDFIVKTPTIEPSKYLASPIKVERFQKMHNTEVDVYEILKSHADSGVAHPAIYNTQKMDLTTNPVQAGHITMEHIKNCQHTFLTDNLKPDDLVEPLKNLARLHALTGKLSQEEKNKVPRDMIKTWFGELFCKANMNQFLTFWQRNVAHYLGDEARSALQLLPEILAPESLEKFNDDCQINGTPEVLCHGDYWPANILFEVLPNGNRKFRSICDFQTSNMGNGAQDLTRLLATGLSGKDRRENTTRLLHVYHDEICRLTGVQTEFGLLLENYNKFLPLHAAVMCTPTPGIFMRAFAALTDENEKKKLENLMTEKYGSILEDMKTLWNGRANNL